MKNFFYSLSIIILFTINTAPLNAFDFAPQIGDKAPLFELNGINKNFKSKNDWNLTEFKNKWLVLYFYPKDFTAGCTIEAKGFTDLQKKFKRLNAEIVGISADNEDSHNSFCDEKEINYTLLSDPKGIVSEKYGSWLPPYSDRNTFLISPSGTIEYRWISVTPINHAKEVLKILEKKV